MSHPKVSVLIPAYNSEKYIGEAIQSILNQTFIDFELLILDDGSIDNTWLEMQKFEDKRIQLLKNEINQGIPFSRNKLIENARGEYLAWLDADDIALPERLTVQTQFMDENPDVGICGSWYETFGLSNDIVKVPTTPIQIQCENLFNCCIRQSTALIRKYILINNDLKYKLETSQDYEMEIKIGEQAKSINLAKILAKTRNHAQRISFLQNNQQVANANKVRKYQLQKLHIEPSEKELSLHHQIVNKIESPITINVLKSINTWLLRIKKANDERKIFPESEFTNMLKEIWLKNMAGYSKLGLEFWKLFSKSCLSPYQNYSFWMKLKLYFKCMLFR